ncbi:MAG: hypothetical protein V5B40_12870 [Candidatus Accumulibacter meliphilus]|jgi:hypothetical protein|uniref:hypothetical protein n=1 Tax=Candidatus Accumulibacter meliphilus TaxID=2211374 RepID=UPI002FC3B0A1
MNRTTTSKIAEAAKRLIDGSGKLAQLRQRFGGGLHFAVDNDVVMGYVSPQPKHANVVQSLLRSQDGFSTRDQEYSLAERVSGHILLEASNAGDRKVFSLPGHHSELWSSLAGSLHARLTQELQAEGSTAAVAKQMERFRDEFYTVAVTDSKKLTIEQLVAAVPDQFRGWLGLGTAAQEWNRLKYLKVKNALQPFPKEVVDRPYLDHDTHRAFISRLVEGRDKWQTRLQEAHQAEGIAEGRFESQNALAGMRFDAVALAFWERLNCEYDKQPEERLVLITSSERIFRAAKKISASELGGNAEESAIEYILHPFDFLDECHVHLTGDLRPQSDRDKSGRLSSALEMLVNADSLPKMQQAETEFGEVWGKFLRASVLERVQRINRAHSTHLRRVAFVFRRVGISSEPSPGNPLVLELAERGSEMLSEAADIRIASLAPDQFTRGAPLLRLDKHPWAQRIQLKSPGKFCELVVDQTERRKLLAEAGDHRYTLHLLQARAMIWAGDWRTALRLCEFSLTIRDKIPKTKDSSVPDIDGREAVFLAAVCERHAHGGSTKALDEAKRYLEEFLELARSAHFGESITKIDLQVHELRESSEEKAIEVTKILTAMLGSTEIRHDGDLSGTLLKHSLCALFESLAGIRLLALDTAAQASQEGDAEFLQYICFRVLQQVWCNEFQIRLCAPDELDLVSSSVLQRLSVELQESQRSIAKLDHVKIRDSWYIQTCAGILDCMLGNASNTSRQEILRRLSRAEIEHSVFPYDRARSDRFRDAIEKTAPSN